MERNENEGKGRECLDKHQSQRFSAFEPAGGGGKATQILGLIFKWESS